MGRDLILDRDVVADLGRRMVELSRCIAEAVDALDGDPSSEFRSRIDDLEEALVSVRDGCDGWIETIRREGMHRDGDWGLG